MTLLLVQFGNLVLDYHKRSEDHHKLPEDFVTRCFMAIQRATGLALASFEEGGLSLLQPLGPCQVSSSTPELKKRSTSTCLH